MKELASNQHIQSLSHSNAHEDRVVSLRAVNFNLDHNARLHAVLPNPHPRTQPQLPHSGPLTSSTVPTRLPPPPPPLGPALLPDPPPVPPNLPPAHRPLPVLELVVEPVLPAFLPGPLVLNLLFCAVVYGSSERSVTRYRPTKL